MRRSLKALLFSAFLLASQSALAVCTGPAGIPFNCTAAVAGPTANDLVLGGVTSGAQNGQTVRWTWGQVFTGTTLTSPLIINGTIQSLNTPLAGLYGGTGIANSGKTITLGGNYATFGAHNLTFTLTGDTNITLPTSGSIITNSLTSAHYFVGNVSNVATDVAMSGDCGLANTGAVTCTKINGKTVSLSGALTTSGSTSTLTMNLGGNTSVTLPTSGTLLTNALTSGHIFVGNAGVATDTAVTGVIAISSSGVTSFTGGSSLIGIQSFCNAASGCTTNSCGSGCTYTPTAGTGRVKVRQCGGGGPGGGAPASGGATLGVGGGGGSGAYAEGLFTSAFSGVTVTVGAGGAGASGTTGTTGGTTSFGALLSTAGGVSGASPAAAALPLAAGGGGGATPSAGYVRVPGQPGGPSTASGANVLLVGSGGLSPLGGGGPVLFSSTQLTGNAGAGFCSGGSGTGNPISAGAITGPNGAQGIVIVEEYS